MNIQDFKQLINVLSLEFHLSEDGNWLNAWDNHSRTRVTVHVDTAPKIAAGEELSYNKQTKASKESGEEYTQYYLVQRAKQPDLVM